MTDHVDSAFDDLPLLRISKAAVDDSDIDFDSDMSYCRELLLEIQLQAIATGMATPFPLVLSDELDHALTELVGIKQHMRGLR